MTKRNGEIEFLWEPQKGQSRMVFCAETGKTIKFNVKSKRAFVSDPKEISLLKKCGYAPLTVKEKGVALPVEEEKVELVEEPEVVKEPVKPVTPEKTVRTKKKRVK